MAENQLKEKQIDNQRAIQRLNVFLRGLEQGHTLELDGWRWEAMANEEDGHLVPCIVMDRTDTENKIVGKTHINPSATVGYLLKALDKLTESEFLAMSAAVTLTEIKRNGL